MKLIPNPVRGAKMRLIQPTGMKTTILRNPLLLRDHPKLHISSLPRHLVVIGGSPLRNPYFAVPVWFAALFLLTLEVTR